MSKIKPNLELDNILTENSSYNEKNDSKSVSKGTFTPYLVLCLVIALCGSFQFGWNIGIFNTPSNIIKGFYSEVYFERNNETISNSTLNSLWSITNGLMPMGGCIGGLSSGFFADGFGRTKALFYTNGLVLITAILAIISKFVKSYETLMISRFITGLYCGIFTGIVPLYLNEIAPTNLTGLIGTMAQLNIVFGILVTNIFGLPQIFGTESLWPLLVGFVLLPCAVHLAGLLGIVESPKYSFNKLNKKAIAETALTKLRGKDKNDLVQKELSDYEEEKNRLALQPSISWLDFWNVTHLRRPLIVTSVIQMSQQLSGINAVIFYSSDIFSKVGLSGSWPQYITIILSVVQLLMTVVCMAIVDKFGRKILLLVGMIGMCISAFCLAIFSIVQSSSDDPAAWINYMTVVSSISYIVFFSVGPGAIPWLITSELFDSASRGKATSIAVLINWISNFIVTVSFPFIQESLESYSFILFGVLLIFFSIFMLLFVPETKNKSSEEMSTIFKNNFIFFRK